MDSTISKAQAIAAVRRRSRLSPDGHRVVHVIGVLTGSDWPLAGVERMIRNSIGLDFHPHALGHDLVVRARNGRIYSLDVSGTMATDVSA